MYNIKYDLYDDIIKLIISGKSLDEIVNILSFDIGFIKNTIRRLKEPLEYRDLLEKDQIFKILNKPEYESIIKQINGELPNVTPVNYYKECKRIACEKSIDELYPMFLKELKKRNKIDIIDFNQVPYALRFLVYFSKFQQSQLDALSEYLNKPFEGVI